MVNNSHHRFLVLLLTTRCNLSCTYCYVGAKAMGEDMNLSVAEEAIDRFMNPNSRLTVQLSGGEPLLVYEKIKAIVRNRQDKRIRFAVQTNGIFLSREKLRFFAENGVGLGLSMDGIPEINEKMRGGSKQVLKAIDLMDSLGGGVNVTTVLTRQSVARFPEFLMFCAQHRSIDTINLDMFRPVGRGLNAGFEPGCDQIEEMVPKMLRVLEFINRRRKFRLKIREVDQVVPRMKAKKEAPYCLGAQGDYAVVTPAGDVYPCASLIGMDQYKTGTVHDIDAFRFDHKIAGWGLPGECRECGARFYCRGGCPSRRIAGTGSAGKKYGVDCALRRAIFSAVMTG